MKVIGFTFTKISAEKSVDKTKNKPTTSIEFTDLNKDNASFLKNDEIIKLSYKYNINYGDPEKTKKLDGYIEINGEVMISVNTEESKQIITDWKKKKLPSALNLILFNVILRRCTPKAIALQDEINLPFHTPMPRLQQKKE